METINWSYVFSTLFIRFIGVFVVLGIVQAGMVISSKMIHYLGMDQPDKDRK